MLCVLADIRNSVTDLVPTDTQEQPFYYMFKVQCTSCRETHPNWVGVSRFVSVAFSFVSERSLFYFAQNDFLVIFSLAMRSQPRFKKRKLKASNSTRTLFHILKGYH